VAPAIELVECRDVGCFDVRNALAHDRKLSVDIGVRRAGQPGARAGADYLLQALGSLGMHAWLQPFRLPEGAETWNVIATPPELDAPDDPSQDPDPGRPYAILGGHYDTVDGAPGANDNASGVAAALDIARALRAQPGAVPVMIVMFGAEEVQPGPRGSHHLGSRQYVSMMSARARRDLVVMMDLDQIGFGHEIVSSRLANGIREASDRLFWTARKLGEPVREQVTPDWSDNGPFLKAGLNAGWLWSGDDPFGHTPRDTIDHLQPESINRIGRVMLAALRSYK
jgi:aminopeptidase YwaD